MTDVQAFFEDVGLPDAGELAVKTEAVLVISKGIHDRGLSQAEFGRLIGWKQPVVSALVRGELDRFSWNRINTALKPFGKQVVTRHVMTDC
ncbi:MAG: XRE family transcriptional regulator [Rhodospirillaceae bacterium]